MTDQEWLERRIYALEQDIAKVQSERVIKALTTQLAVLRKEWATAYGKKGA